MPKKEFSAEMNEVAKILDEASHLLESSDPKKRANAISIVTEQYNTAALSNTQRKLAEQIFKVLMHDAAVNVRHALAENLKQNDSAPREVVLQLAEDIDEVAIPILQYSEVLTDEDLINIIQNSETSESKLLAISNRNEVNEGVSDALVDTGKEKVVKNLMQRAAAKISEVTMGKVVKKFSDDAEMMDIVAVRESLPASIVEKVVKKVSASMQSQLVERYGHVVPNIAEMVEKSQEAATLKVMGLNSSGAEIKSLVDRMDKTGDHAQEIYESNAELTKTVEHLQSSGRLTPISALCMGNLELFEISVARITNVPVANIRKLLHDDSGHGLEAVYKKAKLPENLFPAVRLVVKVIRKIDEEAKSNIQVKKTASELISRLLKAADNEKEEIENLAYFISLIHKHSKPK